MRGLPSSLKSSGEHIALALDYSLTTPRTCQGSDSGSAALSGGFFEARRANSLHAGERPFMRSRI